jgi:hypothetical protein
MIIAVIYFIHAIFAVYIFARSYQSEGWLQAFLNIGFVIILFSVSLTVCEIFTGLVISENGYSFTAPTSQVLMFLMKISGFYAQEGRTVTLTPKDSVTLIFVTMIEFFFYKFYFSKLSVSKQAAKI